MLLGPDIVPETKYHKRRADKYEKRVTELDGWRSVVQGKVGARSGHVGHDWAMLSSGRQVKQTNRSHHVWADIS